MRDRRRYTVHLVSYSSNDSRYSSRSNSGGLPYGRNDLPCGRSVAINAGINGAGGNWPALNAAWTAAAYELAVVAAAMAASTADWLAATFAVVVAVSNLLPASVGMVNTETDRIDG